MRTSQATLVNRATSTTFLRHRHPTDYHPSLTSLLLNEWKLPHQPRFAPASLHNHLRDTHHQCTVPHTHHNSHRTNPQVRDPANTEAQKKQSKDYPAAATTSCLRSSTTAASSHPLHPHQCHLTSTLTSTTPTPTLNPKHTHPLHTPPTHLHQATTTPAPSYPAHPASPADGAHATNTSATTAARRPCSRASSTSDTRARKRTGEREWARATRGRSSCGCASGLGICSILSRFSFVHSVRTSWRFFQVLRLGSFEGLFAWRWGLVSAVMR